MCDAISDLKKNSGSARRRQHHSSPKAPPVAVGHPLQGSQAESTTRRRLGYPARRPRGPAQQEARQSLEQRFPVRSRSRANSSVAGAASSFVLEEHLLASVGYASLRRLLVVEVTRVPVDEEQHAPIATDARTRGCRPLPAPPHLGRPHRGAEKVDVASSCLVRRLDLALGSKKICGSTVTCNDRARSAIGDAEP